MEVKIYCIEDCNGLKYVGSTKNSLNIRLYYHKYHEDTRSRELDLQNCKIYTLEETDEENRKCREQYWMDTIECVNKNNTTSFNKKEWSKIYMKKYNQYTNSWGGSPISNNNLLKIDLDIFI